MFEVNGLASLPLECELRLAEQGGLRAQEAGRIALGPFVEEQLEHELRPEIADVLDRRVAPARERRTAAPRRPERGPLRARIARRRPADLDETRLA